MKNSLPKITIKPTNRQMTGKEQRLLIKWCEKLLVEEIKRNQYSHEQQIKFLKTVKQQLSIEISHNKTEENVHCKEQNYWLS